MYKNVWKYFFTLLFFLLLLFIPGFNPPRTPEPPMAEIGRGLGSTIREENLKKFPTEDFLSIHFPGQVDWTLSKGLYAPSPNLGFRIRPNYLGRMMFAYKNTTIYNTVIETDEYGRRITPQSSAKEPQKFAAFLGCSYAFGKGVQKNETLPFAFQNAAPEFEAYNYGVESWGPNNVLAQIQENNFPEKGEIKQTSGLFFYIYIDHHVRRVVGSMLMVAYSSRYFPYFDYDPLGKIFRLGNFEKNRKWTSLFYNWMARSWIVQKIGIDFPLIIQDHDVELTADLILEIKNELARKVNGGRFVVVLFPSIKVGGPDIIPKLQARGISYFDYRKVNFRELTDDREWIPVDGHPTRYTQELVGKMLAKDVALMK